MIENNVFFCCCCSFNGLLAFILWIFEENHIKKILHIKKMKEQKKRTCFPNCKFFGIFSLLAEESKKIQQKEMKEVKKKNLHKLVILKEQKGAKIQIYHEGILRLDFCVFIALFVR